MTILIFALALILIGTGMSIKCVLDEQYMFIIFYVVVILLGCLLGFQQL